VTRTLKILFLLLAFSGAAMAQNPAKEANIKLKSMFVYSFIKNVEWPAGVAEDSYVISIIGDKDLYQKMNATYAGKVVNNKKLIFQFHESVKAASGANMVYVAPKLSDQVAQNQKMLATNKTLIVTDKGGQLADGSVINFVIADSKLRFEISNTNAQKVPLVIGPALIKMATNVI